MNENEIELKVQALVDGELTGREAEALRQRINDDAGLQQLHVSLTQMRGLIADSELPRPLPESGDFYWNKIAETIEHEKRAGERAEPPTPASRWLLRWLAPVAGVSAWYCCSSLQRNPPHRIWGSPSTVTTNWNCPDDEIDVMTYNTDDDSIEHRLAGLLDGYSKGLHGTMA